MLSASRDHTAKIWLWSGDCELTLGKEWNTDEKVGHVDVVVSAVFAPTEPVHVQQVEQ